MIKEATVGTVAKNKNQDQRGKNDVILYYKKAEITKICP
jgi:hypothetical protein